MTRGRCSRCCRPTIPDAAFADLARRLRQRWRQLYLVLSHRYAGDDAERLARLAELARATGARPLATNDVHYHHPDRRPLQDVVTCIREHTRITEAAPLLFANAERHLKPPEEMARLFRDHPQALESTLGDRRALPILADRAGLRLPGPGLLRRPHARRGAGATRVGGSAERYPGHLPAKVERQLQHELELIASSATRPTS